MRFQAFFIFFFLFLMTNIFAVTSHPKQNTYEYKLANGLRLIVRVDNRAPVVLSSIWYKVGGSYEHNGITGVSHMLEHMMFTGTKRYPFGEFEKIINDIGGVQNAMTTPDFTMYYQKLASDKLATSFKLEADRMQNLVLQQKIYDKEHNVVMEERRMRVDDNPMSLAWERFNATAFLNNPYHHPVIGWMTDIKNLTLNDLTNWYHQWYVPNNAVVIVVGDVDPKNVYQLAQQYFGPLKAKPIKPLKPRTEVPAFGTRYYKIVLSAKLPWVIMGYNTPSLSSLKTSWKPYALEVAAYILGGGDSSRFANELVRGKGIAVSADASYNAFNLHSNLFVLSGVPSQASSISELTQAFLNQIKKLQTTLVSEEELNRVKAQIIAQNVYQKDSLMYQAFNLGVPEMMGLSWKTSDEYVSNINAVTAKQVQTVAKEFLNSDRLTLTVLIPKDSQYKNEKVLEKL